MRSKGSPIELEHRRILGVRRVLDGYSQNEVARFLGVARFTVRRWMRDYRHGGWRRLRAANIAGRPASIDGNARRRVLSWIARPATDFGFATNRWTAPRITRLLAERMKIQLHPRHVSRWLKSQGVSPQVPAKVPQERDEQLIQEWVAVAWPRLKKKPAGSMH